MPRKHERLEMRSALQVVGSNIAACRYVVQTGDVRPGNSNNEWVESTGIGIIDCHMI
jgi:hypothetical protein